MVVAAIIMVSVFAGFVFSDDPMIKQFGFALAVGVVIDAFLVRGLWSLPNGAESFCPTAWAAGRLQT